MKKLMILSFCALVLAACSKSEEPTATAPQITKESLQQDPKAMMALYKKCMPELKAESEDSSIQLSNDCQTLKELSEDMMEKAKAMQNQSINK